MSYWWWKSDKYPGCEAVIKLYKKLCFLFFWRTSNILFFFGWTSNSHFSAHTWRILKIPKPVTPHGSPLKLLFSGQSCQMKLWAAKCKKSELLTNSFPRISGLRIANPLLSFKQPYLGLYLTDFKNSKACGSARISSPAFIFRPKLCNRRTDRNIHRFQQHFP